MTSSVLNGDIMTQKEIFWTIGENLYFSYYPIISYQWINFYRVERMDIGKISLTRWCQWDIQMQPIPLNTMLFIVWYDVPCYDSYYDLGSYVESYVEQHPIPSKRYV